MITYLFIPHHLESLWESNTTRLKKSGCIIMFIDFGKNFNAVTLLESLELETVKRKINSAIWVLPKEFDSGINLKKWPASLYENGKQSIFNFIYFEEDLERLLASLCKKPIRKIGLNAETIFTCQYEFQYTETLKEWESKNYKTFHPGDYYKDEILHILSEKQNGIWIYFGHAEADKLRGYGQITTRELLKYKPKGGALDVSILLACSTISRTKKNSIGLAWWKARATNFLMASTIDTFTKENQFFASLLLEEFEHTVNQTLLDLLLKILNRNPERMIPFFKQYHFLGFSNCIFGKFSPKK